MSHLFNTQSPAVCSRMLLVKIEQADIETLGLSLDGNVFNIVRQLQPWKMGCDKTLEVEKGCVGDRS